MEGGALGIVPTELFSYARGPTGKVKLHPQPSLLIRSIQRLLAFFLKSAPLHLIRVRRVTPCSFTAFLLLSTTGIAAWVAGRCLQARGMLRFGTFSSARLPGSR